MFVGALTIELFFDHCHSLKEKRAVVRPIVDGLRRRFEVAAAEVDALDLWQRTTIGVATVSGTASQVDSVLDACERFVWSFPEVDVVAVKRSWLDPEGP